MCVLYPSMIGNYYVYDNGVKYWLLHAVALIRTDFVSCLVVFAKNILLLFMDHVALRNC